MSFILFLKTGTIWFIIATLAVVNGVFRESILTPNFGQNIALPTSGIILSIIIFMVTYVSFKLFGKNDYQTYFLIGVQWVLMTLIFEFLFGYYVAEKTWSDLFQVFNIMQGDLFILVLLVSLFSPILVGKIKGIL
ncbi:MAG: hypothetical protein KC427_07045 [Sulfurovum sp.]|uniref:hypothetical protein n=1 Tax=Sulfurovum sp. TaxID=1969726 RepID=UPI002867F00A|nr:hypothetical protein [Sulfurovum sp.]MCO4845759.1 hypothetical protein [Sulfurovum sp.]